MPESLATRRSFRVAGLRSGLVAVAFCLPAAPAAARTLQQVHQVQPGQPGQPASASLAAPVLDSFEFRGVSLEVGDAGDAFSLRGCQDRAREFYLRIPNDDLLKGFRARAGKPAPGRDLGGWYDADVFHVFGQILSGLARMHAATGDEACREKLRALVAGWAECIENDGWFYASRNPNARHYTYDKLVGGLVDALAYAGVEEARAPLSRITDWASANLSRERRFAFNAGSGDTEWYTLTENLDRAFLVTGETKYRDFAAVWAYDAYWDLFAGSSGGGDLFGERTGVQAYHAYSHVNALGGAATRFLVTGEPRYLAVIRSAFDRLARDHLLATGGFGPDEQLVPPATLQERLATTHRSFETQCGSYAALKLTKHLIRLTGEGRYGDWAESVAINGLAASLENGDDGRVFYYSDYGLDGGTKFRHDTPWTCCSGTRPIALADLTDLVWFRDASGLYANLFTPSTARFDHDGVSVSVSQRTRFPDGDDVAFEVSTTAPVEFSLHVRVPRWLQGRMTATRNGAPEKEAGGRRGFLEWRRVWSDGDVLRVSLPRTLRAIPLRESARFPAAITYGPVVLAVREGTISPHSAIDWKRLDASLVRCEGEALTWRLAKDPSALVRAFRDFREGEPYFMYLDPARAGLISHRKVRFDGAWADAGRFRYSNAPGAAAECTFTGTGVRWLGFRFDDGGRARVTIDGNEVGVVDQFGPGRDLHFDWKVEGLAPGEHRVRVEWVESKTEASRDRYLNVAGFEALGS